MGKMKSLYMDIVELLRWDLEPDEVADQLYCDPELVRQIMKEQGMVPKPQPAVSSDFFDDVPF